MALLKILLSQPLPLKSKLFCYEMLIRQMNHFLLVFLPFAIYGVCLTRPFGNGAPVLPGLRCALQNEKRRTLLQLSIIQRHQMNAAIAMAIILHQ